MTMKMCIIFYKNYCIFLIIKRKFKCLSSMTMKS